LTFDLEVGVGVACDLGYPCAKFRLPRPFGFRVRADVRNIRQTDRQMPITALCPLGGGIITILRAKTVQQSEIFDSTTEVSAVEMDIVRFRFTSLQDFGRLTLGPSYITELMHMHEPWAGQ